MDGSMLQYPPGDPRLVDKIVCQLKSQGIFDRFRKECIADVDTKPAYQNLHQRVEGTVSAFLTNQEWRPELNKNQLRDSLRKHIHESGILDLGVERIVDQVVNPKILPVLLPQIEDVVYNFLGIEKPKNRYSQTVASLQTPKNFKPLKMETLEDLLPKDLDPISPGSVGVNSDDENGIDDVKNEVKDEAMDDDDKLCEDEDSSPPFEPIEKITAHDESSLDSHISGISGLTSHDSQMSNLSYGKETRPPPEPNASHKIPPVDLSNHDSQLSKVSSGSRLSIVFSDDAEKSDQKNSPFTSDMDLQNDDSGLSKNGGVIEFESVAPQPPLANEDSNSAYDSGIIREYPTELPFTCSSPLEPLPDKLLIEDEEPVHEEHNKIDGVGDECSDVVKEPDIEEKYLEDREKESEINDERKHCNASSDSRDSKRSESTFHSSDSEQRKEEKERNHKNKDNLKLEEKIDCKGKESEDKQEYEDVVMNGSEGLKKQVEGVDQSEPKMENKSEITKILEIPEDEEKNLRENENKERDFSKDKVKCDVIDLNEKIINEDNEVKSEKDNKEEIKEKSEKERKANEDRGKENVKDKNKDRETEREGSREKNEKESSKEKSRHEEKNRDSSRDKTKVSDKDSSKEKQKVDVKTDKDGHKDKPKTDERSRKDISKDKARHDRSDKGSSRDSSRHKELERSRSKNEGKDKKDEKSKEDKSKRNEKEVSKEKLKKDAPDATKNDDGEDKRNKSQNDQKREKDRSKETSRHSDKSKSDKGKGDDKVKEVKPETRDGVSKHESKGSEKTTSKDSRSKSRSENKEKEDRSEKKESRKDERNRDKTKEDRNDKDKPKDDKKDKDKSREDKVDRDRSRPDKEKSKDNKSDREKPKDEKEKDRSSRSSHSSKDGENSKKTDRESSSKSRSSSSTSGASDKSRDSRKKEKEKSRSIPDDHSSHRDRNSDDRRSTDRDSNGQSAATRNEAPAARRHERSGVDDGGSNTSSKSDSGGGGSGGNGGGSESMDATVAATPTKKESTDARDTPSDEGVAPSLPFKKRPVLSSPEPNESAAPDEYDCVNNASGKLVLKLKKPKIAANVYEVRKIMHLRKSMAKNEKKKLDVDACEDRVDESSGDEPELRFFTDEEARPDAAFIKFVNDLEKSETLFELAASDEEEMPEHTKAKRAREEPSTSGDTTTPVPSSLKVDTDTARENIGTIGIAKTDTSSGMKESPASSVPRAKSGATAIERREKRRRDARRDTGKDIRTRASYPTVQEGPASTETLPQTPVGEYLPSQISDVLGIDSGLSVIISKDSSPVSEEESRVENVIRSSTVSSVTLTSPTVPCSPVSRGRPPKRRAAGIPAPVVSEVTSVVAPKRLRNDTSSIPDQVPSVVAVDIVKTIETTASRIIYPTTTTTTTSRPSTLGLRRVPTTRSLSPGIINYGGYIPKEIVEVKVLDVDGDDEYSSSIKENNNVDKSSSDDEKGCGDDMSLSKELISTALRDLMMESGLNLGESPAPSAPAPAVTSKDETGAEGATSAPGRRGGVKAVRGRRLGLSRPTRRSGSDSLSPQTSGEFVLSPSRNRDNPEAKAAAPAAVPAAVGTSAREGAGTGSSAGASALPALASSAHSPAGGRRQLR